MLLDDAFWDESPALTGRQEDFIQDLYSHLRSVFPLGTQILKKRLVKPAILRQMGTHLVGFIQNDDLWEGHWRSNITKPFRGPQTEDIGSFKLVEEITSSKQAALWLMKVHREICKESGAALKAQMHPDNFLWDMGKALSAANDCRLVSATFNDMARYITQELPWEQSERGKWYFQVIRDQSPIGFVKMTMIPRTTKSGDPVDLYVTGGQFGRDITWRHEWRSNPEQMTLKDAHKKAGLFYMEELFHFLTDYIES